MRRGLWVVLIALLVACAPVSRADDPIGRISLGVSGGYSTYNLEQVNNRITGAGNAFLKEKDWSSLDALKGGWTFWGDLRLPIPLGDLALPLPFTTYRLPLEFSLSGGYGYSSGSTGGKDYNELIDVKIKQEAIHVRLLYTMPFRFHDNVKLFLAGGPLLIQNQEVGVSHTHRSSAGGGSGVPQTERTEEIVYSGDGTGWQLGFVAEYLLQDRLTLAVDIGYRSADIQYSNWSAGNNVTIEDTDVFQIPDTQTTNLERLRRDDSYVLHGFLDAEATEEKETLGGQQEPNPYGPHLEQLVELQNGDLGIDMSGFQFHIGFRFYFL